MIPAAFDYVRASSVNEALDLLAKHGDDAKILAGGHSLIPAMKLRLSQPKIVIDISRIGDLRSISQQNGKIAMGPNDSLRDRVIRPAQTSLSLTP
jgi:aerobic carbon-monoxide dehydrogenase medium subunit